jgi:uncharacterized protein (TIGR03437 family)
MKAKDELKLILWPIVLWAFLLTLLALIIGLTIAGATKAPTVEAQSVRNPPHTKPCDLRSGGGGGGGGGGSASFTVVSAASFTAPAAPSSIAAIFPATGQSLTSTTATATTRPLPTTLGGAQVLISGQAVPLFYVSPGQINFLMPDFFGTSSIQVIGSGGQNLSEGFQANPNPGIFTASANGQGYAAAVTTFDGRTYFAVTDAQGRPIPVSTGTPTRPNYLVLFGTGFRGLGAPRVRRSTAWIRSIASFLKAWPAQVRLP